MTDKLVSYIVKTTFDYGNLCKLTFLTVSLANFAALNTSLSFIQFTLLPLLFPLTLTFSPLFSAILFELF